MNDRPSETTTYTLSDERLLALTRNAIRTKKEGQTHWMHIIVDDMIAITEIAISHRGLSIDDE